VNFVGDELLDLATPDRLIDVVSAMSGQVYRDVGSRKTFRFEHNGQGYFAKVHHGVGWREIMKNLVQLRLPVVSAANERDAIRRLDTLGIPSMEVVAYASAGLNPAHRRSCIVTAELRETISLEDLFLERNVDPLLKRRLVDRVAMIAKRMHENGLNHRDFYICHFHLDQQTKASSDPRLHVIDLHRAQLRRSTPRRWIVKDIAGLLFSVLDVDFTRRDLFRFMRVYSGKSLRSALREDGAFWRAVTSRARRLYIQENGLITPHAEHLLNE
jgi:hypothetical protein